MDTPITTVQKDLTQTIRHGYAVYAGDVMCAWVLTLEQGQAMPRATRIINVQSAAGYHVSNGVIVDLIKAA